MVNPDGQNIDQEERPAGGGCGGSAVAPEDRREWSTPRPAGEAGGPEVHRRKTLAEDPKGPGCERRRPKGGGFSEAPPKRVWRWGVGGVGWSQGRDAA